MGDRDRAGLPETLRALWALASKDLRLLVRDRAGLFLTFAWPLVLATFFGALGPGFGAGLESESEFIQGDKGRAMAVLAVDESGSPEAKALLAALEAHPRIELEPARLDDARERVRLGERPAYLHLPSNFQGPAPRALTLGVDPRRVAEAQVLRSAVELAAYAGTHEGPPPLAITQTSIHGGPTDSGPSALPPNPFAVTFPQGIIWAVLACTATFAVSLVQERERGTLLRLAVAPLARWQLLAGKALACLIAVVCIELVLMTVALGFGVRAQSYGLLVLALTCTNFGFVGVMTLLAVIGRKTSSAAGLSWTILMSMAMLGGGMLPLFMMPPWLRSAAQASPVAWALSAIEGAVWRGSSLGDLLPHCAALVTLGLACLVVGSRSVREL